MCYCVWLGGKRERKNGGPRSILSHPIKIESFQFKVKTRMKMSGNVVDEIAQANVQSFFVLFFSVSLVIRSFFIWAVVWSFLRLSFFFCLSFLRFFTFSFLSYFDIFFLFLLSCAECFFSQIVNWVFFFIKKFWILELFVFYLFNV